MPGAVYTEAELRQLNLPGFNAPLPAHFDPSVFLNTDWQPTFNATIISLQRSGEQKYTQPVKEAPYILTTIRTKANETHPDVVSTPTRRIYDPHKLEQLLKEHDFRTWDAGGILQNTDTQKTLVVTQAIPKPVSLHDHSAVACMARSLITDKMGGEKFGDYTDFPGTVSLGPITFGFCYIGNDAKSNEPLYQPMMMIGGVIRVHDPAIFPTETHDYREIGWTPLSTFKSGVATKDIGTLVPTAPATDKIGVCAHGQCLNTTVITTDTPDLTTYLGMNSNLISALASSAERGTRSF